MCPKPLHLSNKKSNKKSDVVVRTLMLRGCSKNCSILQLQCVSGGLMAADTERSDEPGADSS